MTSQKKFSVLAPLERAINGFEARAYPRHITLGPPFIIDDSALPDLAEMLHQVAEDHMPMRVRVGELALFGRSRDVEVRRARGILFGAHIGVVGALRMHGAVFDTTFTGIDGWQPHITDHEGLNEDDRLRIEEFCLFVSEGGVKQVAERFRGYEAESVTGQGAGVQ